MNKPDTGRSPSIPRAKIAFAAACLLSAFVSAQTQPASQGGALAGPDGRLTINYRNAGLDRIIDEVASAAGLNVVRLANVEGTVISMTSAPNGDSRGQAVELLNAAAAPLGYRLVLEGSVLKVSRNEPVRPLGAQRVAPHPSTLSAEQATILAGIVQGEVGLQAVLENVATAGISKVAVGDSLANGKIADIQIDRIAYLSDGKTTWVLVGDNLTGIGPLRKESRP